MAQTNDDFWRKIIMSDEAHFYASENPHLVHKQPLHNQRVWAGIYAERIIGLFFFEDDAGSAVTIKENVIGL